MKKMASLFTLLVFLWTSFLTPVSYAQATEMWNSGVSANEEFQNNVSNDITETNNSVDENYDDSDQFTSETSDDSPSLQMDNRELNIALQALPQRSWTMFIPWEEFNLRLKSLSNDTEYYDVWGDFDEHIIKFKKSDIPAPTWVTTTWLATDDSEYEITAWYDNWTIYYYTEAVIIYLNPDSGLMFQNMESLTTIDTNIWNTSKVTDMMGMFSECASLKELDVSNRDTSKVTNMGWMFEGCTSLEQLDLSRWDTSKVTNMSDMFQHCFNLKKIEIGTRDTSSVEYMWFMFYNCIALTELDVSRWDTSNVRYMEYMFDFCINLTELDLSSRDTSNVRDMSYMFDQCDSLETIYVSDKFKTDNVQWYDMFWNNYSLIWWNWTKFDSNYVDYDYATIDAADNPWYFTDINSNKVVVRFFTNGWSDIDVQVIEKWNTIESVQSSKDNAEFKWWYSDEWLTKKFNVSSTINSNLKLYAKWECKPWYYDNRWICTNENKKIEHKWWVIKITDGENTVYIKDKNQWATQAKWQWFAYKFLIPVFETLKEIQGELVNTPFWWLYRYVIGNLSEISWENMSTIWDLRGHYDTNWVNALKSIKSKNDEWNYTDSYGDYYYRWNNTWLAYKDIWFKDMEWYVEIWYFLNEIKDWLIQWLNEYLNTLFIDIPESKIEWWFNGWKIWQEWEWWIQWNPNPCDASKWEYLPTLQDWVKLMQVWWNINWKEVVKTELWEGSWEVYVFGSWLDNLFNWISNSPMELLELLNLDITEDLMIPWAWWIVKYDSDLVREIMRMQGAPEEEIDDMIENTINRFGSEYIRIPLLSPLWVASESWDTVWIYIWEAGIISVTNDIWAIANSIAAPVRCFVDESAWPKDEEKKENNYSGWGWRWSSSKSETDTHWSADEQKDVNNDKKTDEKQEEVQKENKSDTPISQDNQWNKWSNSASDEFQQAYDFARSYGITSKDNVSEAKMNWNLTRIQMAKMLSQYAVNVLWKEPDVSKWVIRFNDVTDKLNQNYDNAVILSYQLWIMWQNMKDNKFRPNDEVSRAEFVTALSRLLYFTSDWEYKSTSKYYVNHMEKLKSEWIVTNTNPTMKEKRWYVMLMLMRSVK